MKYLFVALLVALYSVGHASGKAHHGLRNLWEDDPCLGITGRLASCDEPMKKYRSGGRWDTMGMLPNFMKAGLKQVCGDILSATQCLQESIDDPVCEEFRKFGVDNRIEIIAYYRRFCVDKFVELERNWLCLVNVTENYHLNACWENFGNPSFDPNDTSCKQGPKTDCVVNWYKANSACEEEGLKLIRDIFFRFKVIGFDADCKLQDDVVYTNAPPNVKICRVSPTVLIVSWDPPKYRLISDYKVYYHTNPDSDLEQWNITQINYLDFIKLKGLEPNKSYAVRVAGMDRSGRVWELSETVISGAD